MPHSFPEEMLSAVNNVTKQNIIHQGNPKILFDSDEEIGIGFEPYKYHGVSDTDLEAFYGLDFTYNITGTYIT